MKKRLDRGKTVGYNLINWLVKLGGVIVGGNNFGCGSSREQAPLAILGSGVKVVAAKSFARIFYRNCINLGICPLEISEDIYDNIVKEDIIEIDLKNSTLKNITKGTNFSTSLLEKEFLS